MNGLELADDASLAAVDRWVSEAQEHHNWFLGRIALYGVNAYWHSTSSSGGRNTARVDMHPGRAAVKGAYQAYLYALLRDPRDFLTTEEFLTICGEMEKHALDHLWPAVREYLLSEPDDSGWRVTEVQGPLGPRLKFEKSWSHKKSLLAL